MVAVVAGPMAVDRVDGRIRPDGLDRREAHGRQLSPSPGDRVDVQPGNRRQHRWWAAAVVAGPMAVDRVDGRIRPDGLDRREAHGRQLSPSPGDRVDVQPGNRRQHRWWAAAAVGVGEAVAAAAAVGVGEAVAAAAAAALWPRLQDLRPGPVRCRVDFCRGRTGPRRRGPTRQRAGARRRKPGLT